MESSCGEGGLQIIRHCNSDVTEVTRGETIERDRHDLQIPHPLTTSRLIWDYKSVHCVAFFSLNKLKIESIIWNGVYMNVCKFECLLANSSP
jgi:hypothetical protein